MILETSNPEFDTIIEKLVPQNGKIKVTVVHADGYGYAEKRTLGRAFDHAVMIYRKRSKRYGYYLEKHHYKCIIFPEKKTEKTENDIWVRSWTNVLARLEKSGLWEDVAKDVRIALDVGYDKIKQAHKQYWERHDYNKLAEDDKFNAEKIKEIDERLVNYRKDGTIYADTSIIWYMHYPAKVKKMHFGRKLLNDTELEDIENALKNKKAIRTGTDGRITNGYDVSYEYNPEINKAWYSEEYRGCGNGHYYLALDATHALFYEDD